MSPKRSCLLFLFSMVFLYVGHQANVINGATTMVSAHKFRGKETDRLALLATKSKIRYDPQGVLRSWNNSIHHCSWSGVACSHRHRRVTALDLSSKGLGGFLSPFIGNLSFLHTIILYNNSFDGSIPPEIGKLARLQRLLLHSNLFQGSLPSEIFQLEKLAVLDVSRNKLTGQINEIPQTQNSLKELYMEENSLSGPIPMSLSYLKRLVTIDLSRNNLSGHIPCSLSSLLFLKTLNLSFNNLSCAVSTRGIFSNSTEVESLTGNRGPCGGIPKPSLPENSRKIGEFHHSKNLRRGTHHMLMIWVITISCVGLGLFAISLIWLCLRKRTTKNLSSKSLVRRPFFKISYGMLLNATNGFSRGHLIGEGNFGSVYKGIMELETYVLVVAVKVFNLQRRGATKSFMSECKALASIRHKNLVKVLSVCSSIDFKGNDFKALVYEYLPNGSLEQWLHWSPTLDEEYDTEFHNLNLLQRVDIAIDIACALYYLHHECLIPIIHCDLKPSNILLDNHMRAYVGDFGLAKFFHWIAKSKPKHFEWN